MKNVRFVLGVALPVLTTVGLALLANSGLFGKGQAIDTLAVVAVVLPLELLASDLSGFLLRSWWALLIVPAAFVLSLTLMEVLIPGAIYADNSADYVLAVILLVILLGVLSLPLIGAAALGAALGRRVARVQPAGVSIAPHRPQ